LFSPHKIWPELVLRHLINPDGAELISGCGPGRPTKRPQAALLHVHPRHLQNQLFQPAAGAQPRVLVLGARITVGLQSALQHPVEEIGHGLEGTHPVAVR
jgi:hypothetical protein